MATSQNRRLARATREFTPKPKGKRTTLARRCFVPVHNPLYPNLPPMPCGDRVLKAARCAEHFADWKHAKESRRGQKPVVTEHRDPQKNHGDGKSASAIANRQAKAASLMRRKVA